MIHPVRRAVAAGFISLYGLSASAMIPDWPQDGWVWAEEQIANLSGIRVFQRELSAPSAPAEMARALSVRLPQLNRLMVLDGQILLSGLGEAHHWLARIERNAGGARAMISALALQMADQRSGSFDPAPYVPADARLRFSHAQTQDGQRITQALYESDRVSSVLTSLVERALSREGWQRQESLPGEGSRVWRRAQALLRVSVQERLPGSVLWLQHQGAEKP